MANSTQKEGSRSGFPLSDFAFSYHDPMLFCNPIHLFRGKRCHIDHDRNWIFISILSATEVSVLVLVSSTVIRFAFASSHLNNTISNTSLSLFLKYPAMSCIKIQE